MEYFAGLDVSMAETHICVVTRNAAVIHQAKVPSTPADIAAELAQVPTGRRVLFETGRMAPMLHHGLSQLGLPVVCVESRQAYQALKSLATHKTDYEGQTVPATSSTSPPPHRTSASSPS
jgi:transposase